MSKLNKDDLISSRAELDLLIATAIQKEGRLSAESEQKKGPATIALENLGKTRISLGNPRDNLIRLNSKLFTSIGLELDPIQKQKMKTENFYYMTISVSMIPGDAVIYDQIKCELGFHPENKKTAIVHSMFPEAEWKEVLKYGADLKLGLKSDLSWGLGINLENPDFDKLLKKLPANANLNVENKNEYKGFIVIPAFSYNMGRALIAAAGVGDNFGYWDIQKPELKQTQTVKFGLIFKVPKTVKKVSLSGVTAARTSKNWLFSNIKPLMNSLTQPQKEKVTKGFPLGDFAEWELTLPV